MGRCLACFVGAGDLLFFSSYVKQRPKETQIRGHNGRFKEALNLRSQVASLLTGYLSKSGPIHLNERKISPFTAIYLNLNTFPVLCRQPATAILAVFMTFKSIFLHYRGCNYLEFYIL